MLRRWGGEEVALNRWAIEGIRVWWHRRARGRVGEGSSGISMCVGDGDAVGGVLGRPAYGEELENAEFFGNVAG